MYDLKDPRWLKNANTKNKVIITFDDGPSRYLPNILDILQEKNVQGVFFWQAKLLHQKRPWQRLLNEGHQLGSHSFQHKNLVRLSKEEQFKDINKSVQHIESITKTKVSFFRPPFGQYNEDTIAVLQELGLIPVMWDISSYDWIHKETPQKIVCNVVENITDGSIILLHELKQTVEVLPLLIDEIRRKGFEFSLLPTK